MKRFLLTSPKLDGPIELVYKSCGMLARISVMDVTLTYDQLGLIVQQLPLNADDMNLLPKGLKAVPAEFEVSFDDYWRAVKKKVNRKRCETLWGKMSRANQVLAVMTLAKYYKYLQRNNRMEADPETYLSKAYYETEWEKI
jgi:hypothetical protein